MFVAAGCTGVNFGDKSQSGAAATTPTADDGGADGAASATGAQGADCIVEPTSGATLCTAISTCPTVLVDHDLYPDCGFRMKAGTTSATSMILECACSGALCPVGVPTTCAQAQKLLAEQNESLVCNKIAEGRCN